MTDCYQGDKPATGVPKVAARGAARGWVIRTDYAACDEHAEDAAAALYAEYGRDVVVQFVAPQVAAWEQRRAAVGSKTVRVIDGRKLAEDISVIRQRRLESEVDPASSQ